MSDPARWLWRTYLGCCRRYQLFAVPMPKRLISVGRVWAHPEYFWHQWERDDDGTLGGLAQLLRPGDVFFDIGANIGQTALIGSHQVGVCGRVVAFEPALPNVVMLRQHVRWNRLRNVTIEEMCVGATDGEAEFSLVDGGLHTSNSLTFTRQQNAPFVTGRTHAITVPVTTLDGYCARVGLSPDVIKIDVEGAELDVLSGGKETLRSKRPRILVGVHPFWWPDGQSRSAIGEFFESLDYRITTVRHEPARPEIFADFICTPSEHMT